MTSSYHLSVAILNNFDLTTLNMLLQRSPNIKKILESHKKILHFNQHILELIKSKDKNIKSWLQRYPTLPILDIKPLLFQCIYISNYVALSVLLEDERTNETRETSKELNEPLLLAIKMNQIESVELLLDRDDLFPETSDKNPIEYGVELGHENIVIRLQDDPRFMESEK